MDKPVYVGVSVLRSLGFSGFGCFRDDETIAIGENDYYGVVQTEPVSQCYQQGIFERVSNALKTSTATEAEERALARERGELPSVNIVRVKMTAERFKEVLEGTRNLLITKRLDPLSPGDMVAIFRDDAPDALCARVKFVVTSSDPVIGARLSRGCMAVTIEPSSGIDSLETWHRIGMWKGPQGWEVRGAEEYSDQAKSLPDLNGLEKWQRGAFRSGWFLAEEGDKDLANRVREYQAREAASFIAGYESCGADNFANGVPLDSKQTNDFLASLSPRNAQAYRDGYERARAKHGDMPVTATVDVNKLHAAIQSLLGKGKKFDDGRVLEAINSCVLP